MVLACFSVLLCGTGAAIASDGMIANTPTAIGALLGVGTGVASLVIWIVKRLINILASEMTATREAFTVSLDRMVKHDAQERAKDRQIYSDTLREILAVSGD
jgi:hypothetical protein